IEHGRVDHASFGIAGRTFAPDPAQPPIGLEVTAILPGGPADQAGLQQGDVMTEINGDPVHQVEQLVVVSLRHTPGDTISIGYQRGGEARTTDLTLGSSR